MIVFIISGLAEHKLFQTHKNLLQTHFLRLTCVFGSLMVVLLLYNIRFKIYKLSNVRRMNLFARNLTPEGHSSPFIV